MWDEEKFFKDFVKESESIKPDREFIDNLKQTANDSNQIVIEQRRRRFKVISSSVIAAALLLCFTVGLVMWNDFGKTSTGKDTEKITTPDSTVGIHAGKDNKGIYIGTIGESSELETAIEMLEDDSTQVTSGDESTLSEAGRKKVITILNSSQKVNDIEELEKLREADGSEDYELYELTNKVEKLSIKVYASGYVVINDKSIYKVDMSKE